MSGDNVVVEFNNAVLSDEKGGFVSCPINIVLNKGQRLFVHGLSDYYRTVFMMSILGFVEPDEGEILLFGNQIPYKYAMELLKQRRVIGYVHSQNGLLKNLSIRENIMLPMQIKGNYTDDEIDKRVDALCSICHIETDLEKEAWGLTKLEEKKILLARSAAAEPQLLLIDDPTSYLENKDKESIRALIEGVLPVLIPSSSSIIITTEEEDWAGKTGDSACQLREAPGNEMKTGTRRSDAE